MGRSHLGKIGFIEKVTLSKDMKRGKIVSYVDKQEENLGEGNSQCKALRWEWA